MCKNLEKPIKIFFSSVFFDYWKNLAEFLKVLAQDFVNFENYIKIKFI